ncbi:MAG TPA: hypothetical protein VFL77_09935 [Solirubrobacterales bacterium]|nr:hypothetical protein [Solirubrobacterales bacterium]
MSDQGITAWKLPLIVAAIAVAIVAAFYVGGPGMGMAEGSLVAGVIVVMAVRHPPLGPIVPAEARDHREHLLVVVDEPLEDGSAIERIAAASVPLDPADPEPEVRVVAPAHNRFLDRWACDRGRGWERAQRNLVLSLASLAGAGVDATARIGDEDIVQTVTDQLREYPATEVFVVTGTGAGSASGAVAELRSRLQAPFHLLRTLHEGRPEAHLDGSSSVQTSSTTRSHSASTSRDQP